MPFASQHIRVSLVLLLLCSISSVADAEVIARKSVSYFDIKGDSAEALDASLNARGPVTMGSSSRHPGATKIHFSGNATYTERNGRCYITDVKITVYTEIILPRWRDRRHASRQLSMIWDTLSEDIRRHEDRHAEIARDHARQMEKAILALPSAKDCDTLQDKANDVTMQQTQLHDEDQARFDKIEAINFQSRIQRLMTYRSQQTGE
ncbi:DUF922 domain-containing Zn-dependent protease [Rhizobium mayense]|uniref:DUF922 domain-containing protein n=1 Tax=Rhizobium mayense TaxID=1312184 RepID=A0ABT7K086_9HYPH|nr:DUF922 domain-containing protein [Rhizobium mayense]MDL2400579.1 DUF922 domain-containing protein [Rhizobium mayense]